MVSAKTGSGKTAAFLLPMLDQMLRLDLPLGGTRGLILLPTRELALQTVKTFENIAKFTYIKCGLVIGGEAFKHQIASLRKNPEVLIATPGRLVEHLNKARSILMNWSFWCLMKLTECWTWFCRRYEQDSHRLRGPAAKSVVFSNIETPKHRSPSGYSEQSCLYRD